MRKKYCTYSKDGGATACVVGALNNEVEEEDSQEKGKKRSTRGYLTTLAPFAGKRCGKERPQCNDRWSKKTALDLGETDKKFREEVTAAITLNY